MMANHQGQQVELYLRLFQQICQHAANYCSHRCNTPCSLLTRSPPAGRPILNVLMGSGIGDCAVVNRPPSDASRRRRARRERRQPPSLAKIQPYRTMHLPVATGPTSRIGRTTGLLEGRAARPE